MDVTQQQNVASMLARLPHELFGSMSYKVGLIAHREGSGLDVCFQTSVPQERNNIRSFLNSVSDLGIETVSIDFDRLILKTGDITEMVALAYEYLDKNPDQLPTDVADRLQNQFLEIISPSFSFADFADSQYPRSYRVLTEGLVEVIEIETDFFIPEDQEYETKVCVNFSTNESGMVYKLLPKHPELIDDANEILSRLSKTLSAKNFDSIDIELFPDNGKGAHLIIKGDDLTEMSDMIQSYFASYDLLSHATPIDMSIELKTTALIASDLHQIPMRPYLSRDHCMAVFNSVVDDDLSYMVEDIRHTIYAETCPEQASKTHPLYNLH